MVTYIYIVKLKSCLVVCERPLMATTKGHHNRVMEPTNES